MTNSTLETVVVLPLVLLATLALVQQPPATVPAPTTPEIAAPTEQSLNPFKPTSLSTLRTAVRAQEGPHTETLTKAWGFYKQFQGSWRKGAPKPSPEALEAFDAFKAGLKKDKLPAWFNKLMGQAGKPVTRTMIYDPADPAFAEFRQTEETERIKALGLVYLTEHELDRPGAADMGATTITTLMARTTLDYNLHALFARFLMDAKIPAWAMQEATMAIYLNPNPTRNDLEFTAFIFYSGAGKAGWNKVQKILREAADKPEDADAVIQSFGPKVQEGKMVTMNLPGPKQ